MDAGGEQGQLVFMKEAIALAEVAGRAGNLPIGAVLVLDGAIIARGMNAIWQPETSYTRHAEMEALREAPSGSWARAAEMTLYTTLEPCVMCAGAIILHHIGRLVYGAADPYGGIGAALKSLSPYFKQGLSRMRWEGPLMPNECGALYRRIQLLEGFQIPSSS